MCWVWVWGGPKATGVTGHPSVNRTRAADAAAALVASASDSVEPAAAVVAGSIRAPPAVDLCVGVEEDGGCDDEERGDGNVRRGRRRRRCRPVLIVFRIRSASHSLLPHFLFYHSLAIPSFLGG
jgi:hypothetical protein